LRGVGVYSIASYSSEGRPPSGPLFLRLLFTQITGPVPEGAVYPLLVRVVKEEKERKRILLVHGE
jgi:hypothetical protein